MKSFKFEPFWFGDEKLSQFKHQMLISKLHMNNMVFQNFTFSSDQLAGWDWGEVRGNNQDPKLYD